MKPYFTLMRCPTWNLNGFWNGDTRRTFIIGHFAMWMVLDDALLIIFVKILNECFTFDCIGHPTVMYLQWSICLYDETSESRTIRPLQFFVPPPDDTNRYIFGKTYRFDFKFSQSHLFRGRHHNELRSVSLYGLIHFSIIPLAPVQCFDTLSDVKHKMWWHWWLAHFHMANPSIPCSILYTWLCKIVRIMYLCVRALVFEYSRVSCLECCIDTVTTWLDSSMVPFTIRLKYKNHFLQMNGIDVWIVYPSCSFIFVRVTLNAVFLDFLALWSASSI